MRRALLVTLAALVGGCAGIADSTNAASMRAIVVGSECAGGDIDLQIEQGAAITESCAYWLGRLQAIEADYDARWGPVDLSGWTVRIVTHIDGPGAPSTGGRLIVGMTWWGPRVIDLVRVTSLAHEMHHVQLGPGSYDHHGWCPTFTDWEASDPLVLVDDSYLCP
jgi:hypothetical protein